MRTKVEASSSANLGSISPTHNTYDFFERYVKVDCVFSSLVEVTVMSGKALKEIRKEHWLSKPVMKINADSRPK